jgi:hypothetical protein
VCVLTAGTVSPTGWWPFFPRAGAGALAIAPFHPLSFPFLFFSLAFIRRLIRIETGPGALFIRTGPVIHSFFLLLFFAARGW